MKFGQLIEYNMRNIFLGQNFSYTKCGGKIFPDPFPKNQNSACLWINSLKFIQFVFIVSPVDGNRNILELICKQLAFTSYI